MRQWTWLLLLCACFLSIAAAQSLPITLSQAEVTVRLNQNDGSPDQVRELGLQQLPWKWDDHFLRQSGMMQFRFDIALDEVLVNQIRKDGKGVALSTLKMGNRYRFRLNSGNWTAVGWDETTTQLRLRPRWHLLADNQLKAGSNVLEVQIKAEPAINAGLTAIELDTESASLDKHLQRITTRYATALVVGTLSAVLCFISLAIGWATREKFFWLAAAAEAAFSISQADWLIDYPPVSTWVFNAARSVLFAYYAGLMCWISTLLVKPSAPSLNRAIQVYLWLALPVLALGAAAGDYRVHQIYWNGATLLLVSTCVGRLTYWSWRGADAAVYIYTVGAWMALSFGLYDYALDLLPAGLAMLRLGDYSFLVFNFGLGAVVVQRYLKAQKELSSLRLSNTLQSETATYRERQRMMQDIHDSVGSQLVALLGLVNSRAPREQIQSHTADALDELRMAVDAIDNKDGELTVVLASLRHRLQPRIDAAQLRLVWQVDALPKLEKLTHQNIQHIQRILLEVFSNIIQHANATQVVLSARYDADAKVCHICVRDDGTGFDAAATTGRGLSNIQSRAEMLGATLSISKTEPNGTTVNLGIFVQ
jgi:signal transduction histidine kinase